MVSPRMKTQITCHDNETKAQLSFLRLRTDQAYAESNVHGRCLSLYIHSESIASLYISVKESVPRGKLFVI